MKLTNLDYVQSILSSLGSDEVNSVSDTTESLQVLGMLKTTYYNILSRTAMPEHTQLIQLNPSLDVSIPVMMYVPDGVKKINWIKYFDSNNYPNATTDDHIHDLNVDLVSNPGEPGSAPGYTYVTILPNRQFIDMVNMMNPNNDDVESFTFTNSRNSYPGTYTFYYRDDKQPQFCTIISDYYVIFDSYDSVVDSTLQASKVLAEGEISPGWSNEDDFIPNLDEEQVPLLLNEAKALAFFELKQSVHPKAEQFAKRQWSAAQKRKAVIERPTAFDALPDFGRRSQNSTRLFKDRGWDRF